MLFCSDNGASAEVSHNLDQIIVYSSHPPGTVIISHLKQTTSLKG